MGFWAAFLIPTIFFLSTLPVLFFCNKYYKKKPPSGSVLLPAIKLPLLASRGRWHLNPIATWKHHRDGTFWASVKVRCLSVIQEKIDLLGSLLILGYPSQAG